MGVVVRAVIIGMLIMIAVTIPRSERRRIDRRLACACSAPS